jgi:hypothetical protein
MIAIRVPATWLIRRSDCVKSIPRLLQSYVFAGINKTGFDTSRHDVDVSDAAALDDNVFHSITKSTACSAMREEFSGHSITSIYVDRRTR